MKDGSIIRGEIIKINPKEVRIKTKDGNIVVVKFKEVYSMKKGIRTIEKELVKPPRQLTKTYGGKFGIGAILSKFTYEEPGMMKDEGFFYGIEGSYTFRNQKDLMLKAEGRYSYGKVDYKSTGTETMDGKHDYIFGIRGLVGNDFSASGRSTITPYIGLGDKVQDIDDPKGSRHRYSRQEFS